MPHIEEFFFELPAIITYLNCPAGQCRVWSDPRTRNSYVDLPSNILGGKIVKMSFQLENGTINHGGVGDVVIDGFFFWLTGRTS